MQIFNAPMKIGGPQLNVDNKFDWWTFIWDIPGPSRCNVIGFILAAINKIGPHKSLSVCAKVGSSGGQWILNAHQPRGWSQIGWEVRHIRCHKEVREDVANAVNYKHLNALEMSAPRGAHDPAPARICLGSFLLSWRRHNSDLSDIRVYTNCF